MEKNVSETRDSIINEKLQHVFKLMTLAEDELKETDIRMVTDVGWCDIMNGFTNQTIAKKHILQALLKRTDDEKKVCD